MTIILIKGNDLGLGAFAAYDLPANQCVGELLGPICNNTVAYKVT